MIDRDALQAAVGSGLVTEAQAAGLLSLANARATALDQARSGEEPFELFKGFNEVFIVVGLAILTFGWMAIWALVAGTSGDFRTTWLIAGVATAGIIVLLSEYFIRRRRMVAPAIALACGWTATAFGFWSLAFNSITVFHGLKVPESILPLALTTVTIGLFWWRFRVPFAMALMAGTAFICLMFTLVATSGQQAGFAEMFLLSASGPFAWGTLLFGLFLFAVAMWFDMSDPHRVTLRSVNGFWLHVIAAPAIVNTIALTLISAGGAVALVVLSVFLLAIAFVAVVIDRRSFLISAVGYLVALLSTFAEGWQVAASIFLLGAGLVGLGAGWQAVRRRLMGVVPDPLRDCLPPSH
ncbi:hypothetical protein [Jannaschia pohangensis]|uniref:DUF2157 domain-containing protein n=1 Tax=Jannaschia pohangensis TaxID=390807 RepID=A0A1I3TGX7_9RHOB|nr:hypothetical protein [Jannaschia pohangensis]SFJ69689.1 hypothetical protein SAMN04488095_3424 [Jannaschia pohangensis]